MAKKFNSISIQHLNTSEGGEAFRVVLEESKYHTSESRSPEGYVFNAKKDPKKVFAKLKRRMIKDLKSEIKQKKNSLLMLKGVEFESVVNKLPALGI
jgi:uncharacterized surface anchored protein